MLLLQLIFLLVFTPFISSTGSTDQSFSPKRRTFSRARSSSTDSSLLGSLGPRHLEPFPSISGEGKASVPGDVELSTQTARRWLLEQAQSSNLESHRETSPISSRSSTSSKFERWQESQPGPETSQRRSGYISLPAIYSFDRRISSPKKLTTGSRGAELTQCVRTPSFLIAPLYLEDRVCFFPVIQR